MKNIFWILILLTVFSCEKQQTIPSDLMNQSDMVSFLIDLHVAQAEVQNLRIPADSSQFLFLVLERKLLSDHQLGDSIFYESYSWYLAHPEIMHEVYTAVVDTLSLRESLARRGE